MICNCLSINGKGYIMISPEPQGDIYTVVREIFEICPVVSFDLRCKSGIHTWNME